LDFGSFFEKSDGGCRLSLEATWSEAGEQRQMFETVERVFEKNICRQVSSKKFERLAELRLLVFGALERRLTMKQLELPLSRPEAFEARRSLRVEAMERPTLSLGAADMCRTRLARTSAVRCTESCGSRAACRTCAPRSC
jgi:hypothetical protein